MAIQDTGIETDAEKQRREDAEALKNKAALDRQRADRERFTIPGPVERLMAGRVIVPERQADAEPARQVQPLRQAEPMEYTPGLQTGPSPGGGNYVTRVVRPPAQNQPPTPEPNVPPTPAQAAVKERLVQRGREDLVDQVQREQREKREAMQKAYDALSPEDRRTIDALNQLKTMERGKLARTHDSDLSRANTREWE